MNACPRKVSAITVSGWASIGVRPIYHFNDRFSIALEAGVDWAKSDPLGTDGHLWKITLAPQISRGGKFFSRPVLREATRVLVAKGLVLSRQRAGAIVRPRNEWHLLDPDVLYWLIQSRPPAEFVSDRSEPCPITHDPADRHHRPAQLATGNGTTIKR